MAPTFTASLVWYGHTAPGLVEARVRTYLNGRAIEEKSFVGVPKAYPFPLAVQPESLVDGLDDASLQQAAKAGGLSTWDETHVCAILATALGLPCAFEPPAELVAREAAEQERQKADDEARLSSADVSPADRILSLKSQIAEILAENPQLVGG